MIRHGARQRVVGGEPGIRPVVLVPPAAADPLAGGRPGRLLPHSRDDLVERPRADQVHGAQRLAETQQVGVSIDHSRDHGAAGGVEPLRAGTGERQRPARTSHEGDAAIPHRKRLGDRSRRIRRVNAGVEDDQVRLRGEGSAPGEHHHGQQHPAHGFLRYPMRQ
jgi:hypothetical protein